MSGYTINSMWSEQLVYKNPHLEFLLSLMEHLGFSNQETGSTERSGSDTDAQAYMAQNKLRTVQLELTPGQATVSFSLLLIAVGNREQAFSRAGST